MGKEDTELMRVIGRVEGTLDAIAITLESQSRRLNHHSGRLRKVENRQHWYAGGVAAVVVGFNYLWNSLKGTP